MATHYPDHENMTVAEAMATYRYMQPDGIYCDGERKSIDDSKNDIVKYFEVCSGITYYYTTAAQQPEPEKQPEKEEEKTMTNYIITLQNQLDAETRKITVSALNEKHARIKGHGHADMFEFIAAIRQEPTGQEKTDHENREHCRRIAEDVEAYANGDVYRCPDCGEIIELPDGVGDKYRCPDCETVHDVEDLEPLGLWDYFDDMLDIEYRIGSDRQLRSVQIMVTCGGPNIYIDTATRQVELYWWGDRANFPIDPDVCDAIDAWAKELYQC